MGGKGGTEAISGSLFGEVACQKFSATSSVPVGGKVPNWLATCNSSASVCDNVSIATRTLFLVRVALLVGSGDIADQPPQRSNYAECMSPLVPYITGGSRPDLVHTNFTMRWPPESGS